LSLPESGAQRFMQLVAPLEKKVYFTCLRMMGNREDAEDCAQEALLKAYGAFSTFRGEARFSNWLYTLMMRTCLDALRRRKDDVSLDALREEGYEPAGEAAEAYLKLEQEERRAALIAALNTLPADFRAVMVLLDLQGLTCREAARVLDIPEGTVKSRASRARRALYRELSRQKELFTEKTRHNDERRSHNDL